MSRTIVTTSHKPDALSAETGLQAAAALNSIFVERERRSLEELKLAYDCQNILVVKGKSLVLYTENGEYTFHPSMSVPRIKGLKHGQPDNMLKAMALQEGDSVLDCTLGLASDAIVASFAVGAAGRVVGLESAPELAYLVREGLTQYKINGERKGLREAMLRITVINSDYLDFLKGQPDGSFDIVYFDPMFRFPRSKSSSMKPLRSVVNPEPVQVEAIAEAVRVARKRVVLKENWFSKEFKKLGFDKIHGGKYSPVSFGIIEKQGDQHE